MMQDHAVHDSLPDANTLAALQEIERSFAEAEFQLACKQAQLFQPLYAKRDALVKNIPKFWSTVLEEYDDLAELINLEDQVLLSHLASIQVVREVSDPRTYEIAFTFAPNEYLEEESLCLKKRMILALTDDKSTDPTLKSRTVPIKWKNGKDLTQQKVGRPSFFTFFAWTGQEEDTLQEGEEVAAILADAIYPDALKLWSEAVSIGGDEDDDSEGSVALDGSDANDDEGASGNEPDRKRIKV